MEPAPRSPFFSRGNAKDWTPLASPPAGTEPWLTWLGRDPSVPLESEEDRLNRALVAGLMVEVMLANPRWWEEPSSRRHRLKACLQSTLASHLAGRMPLASFQSLAQGLDRWFEILYPLITGPALGKNGPLPAPASFPPGECLLREDLFGEWLAKTPGLLPRRRHRKLDRDKLWKFLENTRGDWFRLRDFEEYFRVDRKTAWEYVQKLLQAGLLVHNQGHSSAVRYRLASRFLRAPGESLPERGRNTGQPGAAASDWVVPFHL